MKALHRGWCLPYGYPNIGFWSDNGGEFRNSKMEEFVSKLGLKIKFTPAYSPWSNGINERNHYNCDVIVKKIMEEDKKVGLGEAVDMASWTHNTNVNVKDGQKQKVKCRLVAKGFQEKEVPQSASPTMLRG